MILFYDSMIFTACCESSYNLVNFLNQDIFSVLTKETCFLTCSTDLFILCGCNAIVKSTLMLRKKVNFVSIKSLVFLPYD